MIWTLLLFVEAVRDSGIPKISTVQTPHFGLTVAVWFTTSPMYYTARIVYHFFCGLPIALSHKGENILVQSSMQATILWEFYIKNRHYMKF